MIRHPEKTNLKINRGTIFFAAASLVYLGFAIYLFQPYFRNFNRFQPLVIINVTLASMGTYILSRRWVSGFAESLLAGALYGFGPFFLWLGKFHPTAGLLAAAIPWLFCPTAFNRQTKRRWLNILLATLPFISIVLFFKLTVYLRLFAIPIQTRLLLSDIYSLLVPLVAAKRGATLIGFYHIPIAGLIIGFSMLIKARRYPVMIILVGAIILSFCGPVNTTLEVSPVIWLTICLLCCSIITGAGLQGLVSAGYADRKWLLSTSIVLGVLAIITLLLATKYFQVFLGFASGYARLFTLAAKIYLLGSVTTAIIFFICSARLRLHLIREGLVFAAISLDIFLGATYIVDTIL